MQGRFVTFEGIDGTGKSTCIRAVEDALRDEGVATWRTREETDTPRGDAVRRSIQDGDDPLTTTFLFMADRAAHVREIRAHVAEGEVVLCDRFLHSTLAYQGVTLTGHMPDPLDFLRSLHEPWCLRPDHVVLLTAPPEVCVERAVARSATTPYEKAGFLERVQDNYLALAEAEPSRFTAIDASRTPQDVAADALATVRRALA